jgi:hypothetical protein
MDSFLGIPQVTTISGVAVVWLMWLPQAEMLE